VMVSQEGDHVHGMSTKRRNRRGFLAKPRSPGDGSFVGEVEEKPLFAKPWLLRIQLNMVQGNQNVYWDSGVLLLTRTPLTECSEIARKHRTIRNTAREDCYT
jgi:hypothetical protein